MTGQYIRGAGNGAPPPFIAGRTNIFPPRKRGIFCIVCFSQEPDVAQFDLPPIVGNLHPELHAMCNQMASIRALCKRCRSAIESDALFEALLSAVYNELLVSAVDPTLVCTAFIEVEFGFTFALWSLRGVPFGALGPGLTLWCALLDRYPRDGATVSLVERDLGNGVYAAFSTFLGGLWIDNLVSRDRRRGHARAALTAICQMADAHQSMIYGKVEPNAPGDAGLPIGASLPDLLRWYRSHGFEQMPAIGAIMVMRRPRPRG